MCAEPCPLFGTCALIGISLESHCSCKEEIRLYYIASVIQCGRPESLVLALFSRSDCDEGFSGYSRGCL